MLTRDAGPTGRLWPEAQAGRPAGHLHAERLRAPLSIDGWSPLWTGLARVGGLLPPPEQPDADPWALLRGREHPSGRRGPDGRLVRAAGGRSGDEGPRFDRAVAPGGYAWWYIDAISDDGRFGFTVIGFVGSVFSPYYLKSGRGDPLDHCSINVALSGPRGNRWCMAEHGRQGVARARDLFVVGPSGMRWDGQCLTIDIAESCAVLPFKVKGRIRVWPETMAREGFALDPAGRHHWRAVAPRARVELVMNEPALSWSGHGYWDSNEGSESLEAGFADWQWSRAHLGRDVAVLYEGVRRDGSRFASALRFDRHGEVQEAELPPPARLLPSKWLIGRATRSDTGAARVRKTWLDAPFYARSLVDTRLFGQPVTAVHESLSLTRFASPIVQWMLPYRMPRRL
jgi:carotenoid 1,2-hydratase